MNPDAPATVALMTSEAPPASLGAFEVVDCVHAVCVMSKSAVGDIIANVKNWTVGGELGGYAAMIDRAVATVSERIRRRAAALGADAVVAYRLCTTHVSEGAAEVVGYGTAIRFRARATQPP